MKIQSKRQMLLAITTLIPILLLSFPAHAGGPKINADNLKGIPTVYLESYYISGRVKADAPIKYITINEQPVSFKKGVEATFGFLAALKPGVNFINIQVKDETGNIGIKSYRVNREALPEEPLPKELLARRMRVALFPFEVTGGRPDKGALFQTYLTEALLERNRFQLVEREDLEKILKEHKLGSSKVVEKSTALTLGKLVAAQGIITGSIRETASGMEVLGRMIDGETAEIISTVSISKKEKGLAATELISRAMALAFHEALARHRGIVILKKNKEIFTDLGEDKVKLGTRLIFYRTSENGKGVITGYARVVQIQPEMSKAELIKGDPGDIKKLDRVVVQ